MCKHEWYHPESYYGEGDLEDLRVCLYCGLKQFLYFWVFWGTIQDDEWKESIDVIHGFQKRAFEREIRREALIKRFKENNKE